jgi:hypothetical protein
MDRPEHPYAEAEVLREDRERQVLPRDGFARLLPEPLVLGLPVVDPSTFACLPGGSLGDRGSHGDVGLRAHVSFRPGCALASAR